MNKSALFHESRDNYCYALDDSTIKVTLKTGEDIKAVTVIWGDPFDVTKLLSEESAESNERANKSNNGANTNTDKCKCEDKIKGERDAKADGKTPAEKPAPRYKWNTHETPILTPKLIKDGLLWSAKLTLPFKRCKYYFKVSDGAETVLFLEDGVHEGGISVDNDEALLMGPKLATFTFPWLNAIDVCKTPLWARDAIFYQIFPSSFGNLATITKRLDYLKALGVTALYLTPVNEAKSYHKYDTTDYTKIDSAFGTNEEMTLLVKCAHEHGIRVILDGVFNHSGWFFFAWQDVLKNHERSKYASWFCVNDFNIEVNMADPWSMRNARDGKYFAFAFADFMPKLNTADAGLSQYIITVCKKWVREYDIDGLRLDVANELSHKFIKDLHAEMYKLKSDFYIVGEAWHNVQNFLRGDEFSSTMNYPLQNVLLDFVGGMMTAQSFERNINRCYSMYFEQVSAVLFNQLDSHDTPRAVTQFGENKDKLRCALALLFTLSGTPCLYYGTEIALPGGRDPDCRRPMPWEEVDKGTFNDDIAFTRLLCEVRKAHDECKSQNIEFFYDLAPGFVSGDIKAKSQASRVLHYKKDGKLDVIVNLSGEALDLSGVLSGQVLIASKLSDKTLAPDGFVISA